MVNPGTSKKKISREYSKKSLKKLKSYTRKYSLIQKKAMEGNLQQWTNS